MSPIAMKAFGIVGYSGSGKTTLIERLLPWFMARGLKVAVIKQSHHDFELDVAGKDSWRHRQAGAYEVLISSPYRWAVMHELRGAPEPSLDEHIARLSPCDLVLVEGFKRAELPKLEVWRSANAKPWLHPEDGRILAVASDAPPTQTHLTLSHRERVAQPGEGNGAEGRPAERFPSPLPLSRGERGYESGASPINKPRHIDLNDVEAIGRFILDTLNIEGNTTC